MNQQKLGELAEYVHDQLDAGVSLDAIDQALAKSGYDNETIDTVFDTVADERQPDKPSFRQAVLEHHERHDFFDELWYRVVRVRLFHGRLNRANYLFASMCYWFIALTVTWLLFSNVITERGMSNALSSPSGSSYFVILYIVSLVLLVFLASIYVRRMHDLGMSGWWVFIIFIPLMNVILPIYLLVKPGDAGSNSYGPKKLHMSFLELLGLGLYDEAENTQPVRNKIL